MKYSKPLFFCLAWILSCVILCNFAAAKESFPPKDNDPELSENLSSNTLAEGLMYLYDKEYTRALPIFKRIYEKNRSMDVQFWLAYTASKVGECELAIDNYRSILKKYPGNKEISFELAVTYMACGEFAKARREFDIILMNNPSPEMQANIENILEKMVKTSWSFRFSQGVQYDDNITSGPSESYINDGIEVLPVEKNLKKKESFNWLTDIHGDISYDMGAPERFIWYSRCSLFNSYSFENTDFNYLDMDVSTGPLYRRWPNVLSLPMGISHLQYGGEGLSTRFYISPDAEHFFTDNVSLRCGYTFMAETYAEDEYSDAGYDNVTHTVGGGPKFYFKDMRHIFTTDVSYQYSDADKDRHTYEGFSGFISYFTSFKTKTDLYAMYKYTNRNYDDVPSENYTKKRHDYRDTVIVIIGQDIFTSFFASLEFVYINNNSNADIYDFDKVTSTLTIGVKI